jgi:dipeptidase E
MEVDSVGKIVAIGGVTPPSTLDLIDEEIIKLTNKKSPKVLYIPTAGGDDLGYCNFFKGIYEGKFGCKVDVLFLIRETPTENEIREKVFSTDIIYVDGGSESRLMTYLKRFNMDKILKEAYEKEIVLTGKSAGAICWGKYDNEFQDTDNYIKINCLNFLEFVFCPHYNMDKFIAEYEDGFDNMIKEYDLVGIGIDNDCAIEFVDNKYRVISSSDNANAYKVHKEKAEIIKGIITKDCNFRSLNDLIYMRK